MSESESLADLSATIQRDHLSAFIDPLSMLHTEVVFDVDDDGLTVAAKDPANVVMAETALDAPAFDSFRTDPVRFGYRPSTIQDLLEDAPDAAVSLYTEREIRKFGVRVGAFELCDGWIDPDSVRAEADLPDLDLPAVFTVRGSEFSEAVRYADEAVGATHAKFTFEPGSGGGAEFTSMEKEGTKDGEYRWDRGDLLGELSVPDDAVSSLYSIDYLRDIADVVPEDAELTIHLGDEFPMEARYPIADGHGSVRFLLAPRVQS